MNCCVTVCEKPLDENFWDAQWKSNTIGWDIGHISPPLADLISKIENKKASILIPGCGSAYEAEYIVYQGFEDITLIDISKAACDLLKEKFNETPQVKIIHGDFFQIKDRFDVIIEQTFFCAIPPQWRTKYLWKMHQILNPHGILMGLFFNRTFEAGPPFGGDEAEYRHLFSAAFEIEAMNVAKNSIEPRKSSELQFLFRKKEILITKYQFKGITCNGCRNEIEAKLSDLPNVIKAIINSDFSELIIISDDSVALNLLNEAIAYDSKYRIELATK
jgi:SAM-dependent methyltransferase